MNYTQKFNQIPFTNNISTLAKAIENKQREMKRTEERRKNFSRAIDEKKKEILMGTNEKNIMKFVIKNNIKFKI